MTNRALRHQALFAVVGAIALVAGLGGPAQAARTFVKEIEARAAKPPVPGATLLDAGALAVCLTRALDLEKAGIQLDHDGAEIDRLAATAALMGRGIDLGATIAPDDEEGPDSMNKLHKRFMDYDAMAAQFQNKARDHQAKRVAYDNRVQDFDADCDKAFRPDDLIEAKRKLRLK